MVPWNRRVYLAAEYLLDIHHPFGILSAAGTPSCKARYRGIRCRTASDGSDSDFYARKPSGVWGADAAGKLHDIDRIIEPTAAESYAGSRVTGEYTAVLADQMGQ